MKKFKILVPLTCVLTTTSMVAPILSSCGCNKQQASKTIPTDLLNIDGNTLKGFKRHADVSSYDTLEVPNGIKIVSEYAFYAKYPNIKKIVIPASVEEIGAYAFAGLTSVNELDLTALTTNDVYRIWFHGSAFGVNNWTRYVNIKLNDNLSDIAKKTIRNKLIAAGAQESWFVAPTTGHVELTDKKENETDCVTPVETQAKLLDVQSANSVVSVILQKTGGTDGVDVVLDSTTINSPIGSNITFAASMDIQTGHKLANGDHVIYDAIFICKNPINTIWVQQEKDLKLTYTGNGVIEATNITLDVTERMMAKNEQITLVPTIYPKTCTDKSVSWRTSDPAIATVTQEGLVTAVAGGTATIYAKTSNGKEASCTITIEEEINADVMTIEYDEAMGGYTACITNIDTEAAAEITDMNFPSSYDDGTHGLQPVVAIGRGLLLGDEPFANLKTVSIPDSIQYIYPYTFSGISTLEQIIFGANSQLKEIGMYAFSDCNIKKATFELPDSLVRVGYNAFWGSYEIWSKFIKSGNCELRYLIDKNDKNIVLFSASTPYDGTITQAKLVIDPNCRIIADSIWVAGQTPKYPVVLVDFDKTNLKGIGSRAFWLDYTGAVLAENSEIVTPKTLEYIGPGAFRENKLDTVTLNDGLKTIDGGAFAETLIQQNINIPDSVTAIGRKSLNYVNQHALEAAEEAAAEEAYLQSNILGEDPKKPAASEDVGAFENSDIVGKINFDPVNSKLEYLGINTFLHCCLNFNAGATPVITNNIKELYAGSLAYTNEHNTESGAESFSKINITIPQSVTLMQTIFSGYSYIKENWSTFFDIAKLNLSWEDKTSSWTLYYYQIQDNVPVIVGNGEDEISYSLIKTVFSDDYYPTINEWQSLHILFNDYQEDEDCDGVNDIELYEVIWEKNSK